MENIISQLPEEVLPLDCSQYHRNLVEDTPLSKECDEDDSLQPVDPLMGYIVHATIIPIGNGRADLKLKIVDDEFDGNVVVFKNLTFEILKNIN